MIPPLDRFLQYVTFDTRSSDKHRTSPSTEGQRVFAAELVRQLKQAGLPNAACDPNGYVTATLPASAEGVPVIGFIAHLDTSPDASGKGVKPRVVRYDGGDVVLNKKKGIVLSPAVFPEMNGYIGQEIVVTDGMTLLGADDKAGIAAIVSAMQYLVEHDEIKHGEVRVAFTPDEETGRGASLFDIQDFNCQWAYTVDGGAIGELEYENFNAAEATVIFKGVNLHAGYAKGKMRSAVQQAIRFHNKLPAGERPENTEGYEGFYHLVSFDGKVSDAVLVYAIRDHDRPNFEARKRFLTDAAAQMNTESGCDITVDLYDQYYNMKEKIEPCIEIVEIARQAMIQAGVKPVVKPIRGGTDGARLSFRGLPCPNLFAGGHNFHGIYEFLPVHSLNKSMETIVNIISIVSK